MDITFKKAKIIKNTCWHGFAKNTFVVVIVGNLKSGYDAIGVDMYHELGI